MKVDNEWGGDSSEAVSRLGLSGVLRLRKNEEERQWREVTEHGLGWSEVVPLAQAGRFDFADIFAQIPELN